MRVLEPETEDLGAGGPARGQEGTSCDEADHEEEEGGGRVGGQGGQSCQGKAAEQHPLRAIPGEKVLENNLTFS